MQVWLYPGTQMMLQSSLPTSQLTFPLWQFLCGEVSHVRWASLMATPAQLSTQLKRKLLSPQHCSFGSGYLHFTHHTFGCRDRGCATTVMKQFYQSLQAPF